MLTLLKQRLTKNINQVLIIKLYFLSKSKIEKVIINN